MRPNLKCEIIPSRSGNLRIWDEPIEGHKYVIGADTAESKQKDIGVMRRGRAVSFQSRPDYSAAVVIDLEYGQHVASWHGYYDPPNYARAIAALGFYYNDALIVPERNGPGLAVIVVLSDTIGYPSIYRSRVFGKTDKDDFMAPDLGWTTSQASRPLLITRIHEILDANSLFTRDMELLDELRTMEFDEKGVARARGKHKDDRVIALGLALQGRHEQLTGELTSVEEDKALKSMDSASRRAYRLRQRLAEHTHERTAGSHRRHRGSHRYRTGRVLGRPF